MKWFYDMRIGAKLITGFLLVSVITAIVGFMGLSNMSIMSDRANSMYERELLGVSYVKEANIALIYLVRAEKNFLLAPSIELRERYAAEMDKAAASYKEYFAKAKPLFYTEKGRDRERSVFYSRPNDAW